MTLVLSVHGRDTLWVLVDRRLSYPAPRRPVDTAVKVMHLETNDGVGLLAYAGLGATPRGTEPSAWMSAVLRGPGGLTFEQALGMLSVAANKELPKHLRDIGMHFILVPAFVRGFGSRLYSIDIVLDRRRHGLWYRYTSRQQTADPASPSIRLAVAGTGGIYLAKHRPLLRLVKANDRGKVSDHVVADHLARLNYEAHQKVPAATVGPRCIVVWRRRPGARSRNWGGGQQCYTGIERDRDLAAVPTIVNGMDVNAIAGALMAPEVGFATESNFNEDELKRLVARLPSRPDDKLR